MTDKKSKTTKQKSAVGLKYQQSNQDEASSDGAPTIIAKGFGDLAEEIIALARQNGVLVHEDPYLSDFLSYPRFRARNS